MGLIQKEILGGIGVLTLNNPARRNALSLELCGELVSALDDLKGKKVHVAVLRSHKGAKIWSAGHDITQLPKVHNDPLAYDSPMETAFRAIQNYPGPVIAMIQGSVWGGATDLAVTCDLAVGDETASFAITPVKMGLPYNASGIMHFINRVGSNIAREMFFTAEPVDAERAYHFGILNHLVPATELEDFTFALARKIAANSPLAVSVVKEQFRILSEAHPISPEAFERIQALRRKVYNSGDYEEGIKAFLEKRKPKFSGR
jgi:methylmalonyl-CoA decarboxylase